MRHSHAVPVAPMNGQSECAEGLHDTEVRVYVKSTKSQRPGPVEFQLRLFLSIFLLLFFLSSFLLPLLLSFFSIFPPERISVDASSPRSSSFPSAPDRLLLAGTNLGRVSWVGDAVPFWAEVKLSSPTASQWAIRCNPFSVSIRNCRSTNFVERGRNRRRRTSLRCHLPGRQYLIRLIQRDTSCAPRY